MMKAWFVAIVVAAVSAALVVPTASEARRLGGGKSFGMQRSLPAKPSPQTPPTQPGTPQAAAPTQSPAAAPATAGAAAAAAAPARRSWLGPIAGLAAGLGIAALLSHFGLGEGFATLLMLVLLALAAFALIRFVLRRMAGPGSDRLAAAGAGAPAGPPAWTTTPRRAEPAFAPTPPTAAPTPVGGPVSVTGQPLAPIGGDTGPAAAADPGLTLPEGFDLPAFERIAKMIFIRMQAASDAGDLDDLRQFTTPEMFAAVRLELQERAGTPQHTDVEQVEAQVVDHAQEGGRQIVSVRFHGLVREEKDGAAAPFDEIWHLVRPDDESRAWAIAGIQQPQ